MFKKIFITGIFAALMLSSITANAMEKKDINNKSNTLVNNNNNKNNDSKIDLFSIFNTNKSEEETPTGETNEEIEKVMNELTQVENNLFHRDEVDYNKISTEEKREIMSLLDTNMESLNSLEKYIEDNNLDDILKSSHDYKVHFRINWQKKKINEIRNRIFHTYLFYTKNIDNREYKEILPTTMAEINNKEDDISTDYKQLKETFKNNSNYFKSQQGMQNLKNLLSKIKKLKEDDRYIIGGNCGNKNGEIRRDRINRIENEINNLIINPNM